MTRNPNIAAPTPQPDDLGKLSAGATPGPWYVESMENHGASPSDKFDSFCIVAGKHTILDTLNSSGGCLEQSDNGEDGRTVWDETALRDLTFIAALVNAYRSGRLVPAPAAPQATEEPVAWAYEQEHPDGTWSHEIRRTRPTPRAWFRNIRPLYAAPAASRIGVTEEEITKLCDKLDRMSTVVDPQGCADLMDEARLAILALAAPRAGGETGDGWKSIETAVKDDRAVDLGFWVKLSDDPVDWVWVTTSGWYEKGPADRCWYSSLTEERVEPTHWRPSAAPPAPPADQNATQGEAR